MLFSFYLFITIVHFLKHRYCYLDILYIIYIHLDSKHTNNENI